MLEEPLEEVDTWQHKRKQQMGSYGKRIEELVKSTYNVPKNRSSTFRSQLEYAKAKCGMPQALYKDLDQVWVWRNISVHPGKNLPESDGEDKDADIKRVISRVNAMLGEEDQRLNAHLLKP